MIIHHKLIRLFLSLFLMLSIVVTIESYSIAADGNSAVWSDRPWLSDVTSFGQEFDLSAGAPKMYSRGGFGLGTGYVFGIIGVGMPQNTITNIVGPTYEKSESVRFFPVSTDIYEKVDNEDDPIPCDFESSSLKRVKKTSITILEEHVCGVSIKWINFAPFGSSTIYRIITINNFSESDPGNFILKISAKEKDGAATPNGSNELTLVETTGTMHVGILPYRDAANAKLSTDDSSLILETSTIKPGESKTYFSHITIVPPDISNPDLATSEDMLLGLLDENRKEWLEWREGSLDAVSSDGFLGDLFDNTLVLLKTQSPLNTNGIAVMARYSGMWCRDTFGPVRFFIPAGKLPEVKNITSFYDYATRLIGFRNRYPVDLDLSTAPDDVDWNSMAPQQGDDPNLLIIQYYYYFMATGDKEYIREHYGFLKRNMLGQKRDGYRIPFHSDETYQVFIMMSESATMHEFYSADSGFMFTVAADAMAEMAEAIGENEDASEYRRLSDECREKTEEYYWNDEDGFYIPYTRKDTLAPAQSPFANINLRPLWIHYADPREPQQKKNIISTARKLMDKNGTLKSSSKTSYYTGMLPGLLLYNLKSIGAMKQADMAFSGMMDRTISPTGEFAEAYDGKDRWMDYAQEPNIYRPWETSINTEAVLYYVTGLLYDHKTGVTRLIPYLPPGIDNVKLDNLHAGKAVFSLSIEKDGDSSISISIENTGDALLDIHLLTEPVYGIKPPQTVDSVNFDAFNREMWEEKRTIEPGSGFSTKGGIPKS